MSIKQCKYTKTMIKKKNTNKPIEEQIEGPKNKIN